MTDAKLVDQYYHLFMKSFGKDIEIIFKNEQVKNEIIEYFQTLTPYILEEIQKKHRIEEELIGKKFDDNLIPKPISYAKFRKYQARNPKCSIKRISLARPGSRLFTDKPINLKKIPTDEELLLIGNLKMIKF